MGFEPTQPLVTRTAQRPFSRTADEEAPHEEGENPSPTAASRHHLGGKRGIRIGTFQHHRATTRNPLKQAARFSAQLSPPKGLQGLGHLLLVCFRDYKNSSPLFNVCDKWLVWILPRSGVSEALGESITAYSSRAQQTPPPPSAGIHQTPQPAQEGATRPP